MKNASSLLSKAQTLRAEWSLPLARVTNCYRLFDGLGDGLEGIEIEVFGEHWVVGTRDAPWPEGIEELAHQLGAKSLWHKRLKVAEKGELVLKAGELVSAPFCVLENGVKFEISLQAGYSQGLFLDQRLNRQRVREAVAQQAKKLGRAPKLLNTFAYTGGFSVMAALGGAQTTTLDLSQPYLNWAKRNFLLNGLNPEEYGWIKGDALGWLTRWAKAGKHQFEGIILDPPTFGRHGKQTWSVERDLPELVAAAQSLLAPTGWILLSTNNRSLHPQRFESILAENAPRLSWTHLSMPPEFTGSNYLHCAWAEAKGHL